MDIMARTTVDIMGRMTVQLDMWEKQFSQLSCLCLGTSNVLRNLKIPECTKPLTPHNHTVLYRFSNLCPVTALGFCYNKIVFKYCSTDRMEEKGLEQMAKVGSLP